MSDKGCSYCNDDVELLINEGARALDVRDILIMSMSPYGTVLVTSTGKTRTFPQLFKYCPKCGRSLEVK